MLKYRGSHVMRAGFIGAVLIVLIIAIGLSPERLVAWATTVRYQAQFTHAGGLLVGNDVKVSGVKVGSVSDVALRDGKALVTFTVNANVELGSETTAHIRTGSLLGQRILTLESSGVTAMRPNTVIPASRTASPYSLTDAIGDLTTNTKGTDTQELNQSLDTLSATLDQIAPQLGPAFDGLTRLSQSLNNRDATLAELLKHTSNVTAVLGKRSDQLNTLILDANDLVSVLAERRQAIVDLLANTSAVAQQLTGLVADNEKQLAPALEKLNSVTAMLQKNRDNIAKALPGLAKYQITLGETVSTGFYYNAFVPNLTLNQTLQPFLDYAFGLRRGTNAGQPPDNAGPRAEFPFPNNAIPQQPLGPSGGGR
jgi:phospholipid/cholesterol/gamma-HCH transport system substrate-binding protein